MQTETDRLPTFEGTTNQSRAARRPLLAALVACSLVGCGEARAQPHSEAPPRAVTVSNASRVARPIVSEVVGTVRAAQSATIAPLISGKVVDVNVGLGSSVRSGQVLSRLSAPEVYARLAQSRVAADLAERERERADSLQQKNVINPAQYDAALSAATIARAREAEARTAAEHTVLRAPFAGVITAKLANLGDTVIPGQPLLVLEAPHALRFEARVPEVTSENLRIGQQLPIRLDGLEHDLAGNVVEIQPSCDVVTRTRLIKLDLPASPGLRAGRFGRLLLATANTLAISVPSTALVRHGQLEGVFVVDAGVAQLRLVRSGRSQSGRTEIASGLSGDEPVVLDGAAELVDGQRVAVLP